MTDETNVDPLLQPLHGAATDDEPHELAEADEALLRDFGQWLHGQDDERVDEPEIDLFIAPPPSSLGGAQHEARVVAMPGPRRRAWHTWLSHGAVAAATVGLVWVWSALSDAPDPRPNASYTLTLSGGDGRSFSPSGGPSTYSPDSTFGFTLRSSQPVVAPVEVLMKAHRAGEGQGIWIRLPSELLELEDKTLRYKALAYSALPLAAGDWELTFEIGAPGACISSAPDRLCELAGRAHIVIPKEGGEHAP